MSDSKELDTLRRELAETRQRLGVLEDIHAVRTLHFKYGYYMDKCLFGEIVELFADDCEIHFLGGLFRGKAGARRLYGSGTGLNGPSPGLIFEHVLAQDIVDVASDRKSALGRFRCFMLGGVHETRKDAPPSIPAQFWEGGIYENVFAKQDGIWKIKVFNYNVIWQANYEDGWAHSKPGTMMVSRFTKTFPEDPRGPDEIITATPRTWPDMYVVPFHYPNPVTGEWLK